MHRRHFLAGAFAATFAATLRAAAEKRAPRLLLRSSWQVVNIGDIAHSPGVLALIEKHLPEAEATLWTSADFTPAVGAMIQKRFPKLKIVKGTITDGKATNADLAAALDGTDFLLHGSGPSFNAADDVAAFVKHVKKPFGVYGITLGPIDKSRLELLSQARFVYFRDSVSLQRTKKAGVTCPIMEFAPDGAFACDLRDDEAASTFLKASGLEPGKFLCCLSRLRYTPYWLVKPGVKKNDERVARNEAMKEHDHRALREAIVKVVRETPLKVLLCPEDMTQMAIGKEMFFDKLPDDVKPRVVWRDRFWLTAEALSTYVQSAGLFGSEMHSPIMAIGNGIPAIVCRFEEQTSKGLMWRDIGLGDWLFDLDVPAEEERLVPTVLALAKDPAAAKEKAAKARAFVEQRQRETMAVVKEHASV